MTAYDAALDDLVDRIRKLSTRALVGLFWACSTALVPEARAWAEHWGEPVDPALPRGLAAAYEMAVSGRSTANAYPAHLGRARTFIETESEG